MKALVGAFNQEKALVGAFSVIVQPVVEPMDRFAALVLSLNFILAVMPRIPLTRYSCWYAHSRQHSYSSTRGNFVGNLFIYLCCIPALQHINTSTHIQHTHNTHTTHIKHTITAPPQTRLARWLRYTAIHLPSIPKWPFTSLSLFHPSILLNGRDVSRKARRTILHSLMLCIVLL